MLSRLQLLRLSTILPVVVPALLYLLVLALDALGRGIPSWLGATAAISFSAIWLFGVPYLLVAGAALFALRHRSWESHRRAALAAPWLMMASAEVFAFATDPPKISGPDAIEGAIVIALFCLIVGYVYVALALAAIQVFGSALPPPRTPPN